MVAAASTCRATARLLSEMTLWQAAVFDDDRYGADSAHTWADVQSLRRWIRRRGANMTQRRAFGMPVMQVLRVFGVHASLRLLMSIVNVPAEDGTAHGQLRSVLLSLQARDGVEVTATDLLLGDVTAVARLTAASVQFTCGKRKQPACEVAKPLNVCTETHHPIPDADPSAGACGGAGQHITGVSLQCLAMVGPTLRQLGLAISLTPNHAGGHGPHTRQRAPPAGRLLNLQLPGTTVAAIFLSMPESAASLVLSFDQHPLIPVPIEPAADSMFIKPAFCWRLADLADLAATWLLAGSSIVLQRGR